MSNKLELKPEGANPKRKPFISFPGDRQRILKQQEDLWLDDRMSRKIGCMFGNEYIFRCFQSARVLIKNLSPTHDKIKELKKQINDSESSGSWIK